MTYLKAAEMGQGAIVLRNGLQCVKKYGGNWPWFMRRFGVFTNEEVDRWIAEGATVVACCAQHGIGDHDPVEHGGTT